MQEGDKQAESGTNNAKKKEKEGKKSKKPKEYAALGFIDLHSFRQHLSSVTQQTSINTTSNIPQTHGNTSLTPYGNNNRFAVLDTTFAKGHTANGMTHDLSPSIEVDDPSKDDKIIKASTPQNNLTVALWVDNLLIVEGDKVILHADVGSNTSSNFPTAWHKRLGHAKINIVDAFIMSPTSDQQTSTN